MATLRQKDSKIPLRVDLRLKNISKIPLRVEAKPSILGGTEAELKRTSVVVRKKAAINSIDKIKKSTKEIHKKELKPVNLQLKSKAKENRLQPSGKISQKKVQNNGASKTITADKGIKSLKPVSQALKDRNKITTKVAPEKQKSVKVKGKDDPFCLFQKKISEINISDDDPFKTRAEEIQNKNLNHPSQQDIEFVADDRMKNLILSNKELTPSILKSCSNTRTSVMERPSLYNRPKKIVDPYKQALLDIANCDFASEGRRISKMQINKLQTPLLQNCNSLFKKHLSVDPYEEALKSLAELRMHQKAKSCKKVTFKLSGEDRSSEIETKYERDVEKSLKVVQPEITDRYEKCTARSSQTPELEEKYVLPPGGSLSEKLVVGSSSKPNEVFMNKKRIDISTSTSSSLKPTENNERIINVISPISYPSQNNDKNAAIFSHKFKNSNLKIVNSFVNQLRTSVDRQSFFSEQSEHFLDKMNPKIFTPQPVLFYPRIKLPENNSPEFLSKRTTDILSCAPINTPLVLKSLSKQEQIPVCKKLEFEDSPQETNKELHYSRENTQTFYLQNIITQQKILDQLAHQECSIFMHEATFPCETRKYLQNPVVQILNDGDEMHFVPVTL